MIKVFESQRISTRCLTMCVCFRWTISLFASTYTIDCTFKDFIKENSKMNEAIMSTKINLSKEIVFVLELLLIHILDYMLSFESETKFISQFLIQIRLWPDHFIHFAGFSESTLPYLISSLHLASTIFLNLPPFDPAASLTFIPMSS